MLRIPVTLLRGLRHGLVGLAVVAVLMAAFKLHLHQDSDHCHGHPDDGVGMGLSLGCGLADGSAAGDLPDGDGCDACHCPGGSALMPEPARPVAQDGARPLRRAVPMMHLPDAVSHPPDPPPIRLS